MEINIIRIFCELAAGASVIKEGMLPQHLALATKASVVNISNHWLAKVKPPFP